MNEYPWLILAFVFVLLALGALIQYLRVYITHPHQATLRSFVGLLAALVAGTRLPELKGSVNGQVDLGGILTVEQASLEIATGDPSLYHSAFAGIGVLILICLLKVPASKG